VFCSISKSTRDLLPNEVALQVSRSLTIKSFGERSGGDWAESMASQLCKLQHDVTKAADSNNDNSVEVAASSQWTDSQLCQLQNETFAAVCCDTALCIGPVQG